MSDISITSVKCILESVVNNPHDERRNSGNEHRPSNYDAYLERIRTYSIDKWFAKPRWLSPSVCARYGWVNTEVDWLKCVSCCKFFTGVLPSQKYPRAYKESCQYMHERLLKNHHRFCCWVSNPSPESFLQITKPDVSEFIQNLTSFTDFGKKLPILEDQQAQKLGLTDEDLTSFRTLLDVGSDVDYNVFKTAVVLALCGWKAKRFGRLESLHCNYCNSSAGLWDYFSIEGGDIVSDEDVEELDNIPPPEKKSNLSENAKSNGDLNTSQSSGAYIEESEPEDCIRNGGLNTSRSTVKYTDENESENAKNNGDLNTSQCTVKYTDENETQGEHMEDGQSEQEQAQNDLTTEAETSLVTMSIAADFCSDGGSIEPSKVSEGTEAKESYYKDKTAEEMAHVAPPSKETQLEDVASKTGDQQLVSNLVSPLTDTTKMDCNADTKLDDRKELECDVEVTKTEMEEEALSSTDEVPQLDGVCDLKGEDFISDEEDVEESEILHHLASDEENEEGGMPPPDDQDSDSDIIVYGYSDSGEGSGEEEEEVEDVISDADDSNAEEIDLEASSPGDPIDESTQNEDLEASTADDTTQNDDVICSEEDNQEEDEEEEEKEHRIYECAYDDFSDEEVDQEEEGEREGEHRIYECAYDDFSEEKDEEEGEESYYGDDSVPSSELDTGKTCTTVKNTNGNNPRPEEAIVIGSSSEEEQEEEYNEEEEEQEEESYEEEEGEEEEEIEEGEEVEGEWLDDRDDENEQLNVHGGERGRRFRAIESETAGSDSFDLSVDDASQQTTSRKTKDLSNQSFSEEFSEDQSAQNTAENSSVIYEVIIEDIENEDEISVDAINNQDSSSSLQVQNFDDSNGKDVHFADGDFAKAGSEILVETMEDFGDTQKTGEESFGQDYVDYGDGRIKIGSDTVESSVIVNTISSFYEDKTEDDEDIQVEEKVIEDDARVTNSTVLLTNQGMSEDTPVQNPNVAIEEGLDMMVDCNPVKRSEQMEHAPSSAEEKDVDIESDGSREFDVHHTQSEYLKEAEAIHNKEKTLRLKVDLADQDNPVEIDETDSQTSETVSQRDSEKAGPSGLNTGRDISRQSIFTPFGSSASLLTDESELNFNAHTPQAFEGNDSMMMFNASRVSTPNGRFSDVSQMETKDQATLSETSEARMQKETCPVSTQLSQPVKTRKRRRIPGKDKTYFRPLVEHTLWCAWVATPDKLECPYVSQSQFSTQIEAKVPGWGVLLNALREEKEKRTPKKDPSPRFSDLIKSGHYAEGILRARTLLQNCTSAHHLATGNNEKLPIPIER